MDRSEDHVFGYSTLNFAGLDINWPLFINIDPICWTPFDLHFNGIAEQHSFSLHFRNCSSGYPKCFEQYCGSILGFRHILCLDLVLLLHMENHRLPVNHSFDGINGRILFLPGKSILVGGGWQTCRSFGIFTIFSR